MKKSSPKNEHRIFLFCGADDYSSFKKMRAWREAFIKKYGDTDIETFEGAQLELAQFVTNLEAVPFLSEKRLLVVRDFFAKGKKEVQEKVIAKLAKIPDHIILIFHETGTPDKRTSLYKTLAKLAQIHEFSLPTPQDLQLWLREKAAQKEIALPYQSLMHLSTILPQSYWAAENELEKLALFVKGEPITPQHIDALVSPSLSESIFTLTDAIANKQSKKAIATLKTLVRTGEPTGFIFHMIIRSIRTLILAHSLAQISEQELARTLKLHPFAAKNVRRQCTHFTPAALKSLYASLLKIETDLKTGKIKTPRSDDRAHLLAIEQVILQNTRAQKIKDNL